MSETVELGPITGADVADVARLHAETFGDPEKNGYSVATLGADFLADVFYGLNLDNPDFHCDVARADGRPVAFSVYSTNKDTVFGHLARRHPLALVVRSLRTLVRRPSKLPAFIANAMYIRGERLDFLEGVPGWWVVAAIEPDFRSREGERRSGRRIVVDFLDRMEGRMRELRCSSWYGVVDPKNVAINKVLQRRGAEVAGRAPAQGLDMLYYVKRLDDEGT